MDLSLAGAMVEHAHDLAPGQPCVLDLTLAGVEVHLRAHVAWCRVYSVSSDSNGEEEIRYRSGLHFTDPAPEVEAHLRHYLASLHPPTGNSTPGGP